MSSLSSKSETSSCVKEKRTKNPGWSPREHEALFQSLKELRDYEKANNITSPLRDIKLWTTMSEKLKYHDIIRTPNGCKLYWGRYGRREAQFDERAEPKPEMLATSVQRPKVNQNSPKTDEGLFKDSSTARFPLMTSFMTSPLAQRGGIVYAEVSDNSDCIVMHSPQSTPPMAKPVRASRGRSVKTKATAENTLKNGPKKRPRAATKETIQLIVNGSISRPAVPRVPTEAEIFSRASLVKWTPGQLVALEEESVRANGRVPCEERYSVLSQKLGWRVKYQNIKDWFFVNATELEARNHPNKISGDNDGGYEVDPDYSPYYPVYPETMLPEMAEKMGGEEDSVMKGKPAIGCNLNRSNALKISNLGNKAPQTHTTPNLRPFLGTKPPSKQIQQMQHIFRNRQSLREASQLPNSLRARSPASSIQPRQVPSLPQRNLSKPTLDFSAGIKCRFELQKVGLAEIERMAMDDEADYDFIQHLCKMADKSKRKIKAYKGILDVMDWY